MSTVAELNPVSNMPKLEVDGTNRVMFSTRLRIALTDKDVYGQLDGTSAKPDKTTDPNDYTAWLKKENQALNLLTQKLHDTTLTKILSQFCCEMVDCDYSRVHCQKQSRCGCDANFFQ